MQQKNTANIYNGNSTTLLELFSVQFLSDNGELNIVLVAAAIGYVCHFECDPNNDTQRIAIHREHVVFECKAFCEHKLEL